MAKQFQVNTAGTLLTSLLAYFKLEDANDYYGSNNLTNNNSVSFVSGKVNNAASFNGSSNYLSLGSPVSTSTSAFSVAFWVYITSTSQAVAWVRNGRSDTNPNSNGWAVGQGSTSFDAAGAKVNVVCSGVAWLSSSTSLTTGWHHIVVTKNSSNVWHIWVDGSQDANSMTQSMNTPTSAFEIGRARENGGTYRYHNDKIDELAVWDKELTSTEIGDLYNSGSGQTMINQQSSTLTESIAINSSLLKNTGKNLTETITNNESLIKSIARNLTETFTISGVLATVKIIPLTLALEAITLTDSLIRTTGKVLTESITNVDTFVRQVQRTLIEAITTSDTIAKSKVAYKVLTETINLTARIVTYLNGLLTQYLSKYTSRGSSYSNKYPAKGTTYSDKYISNL